MAPHSDAGFSQVPTETHPDQGLSPQELRAKYEGEQGGHPRYPNEDWRYEVENMDTILGYWEWVMHKVDAWSPLDDE
jgi:hypothetical protein